MGSTSRLLGMEGVEAGTCCMTGGPLGTEGLVPHACRHTRNHAHQNDGR